jgi:hypothetical protein
VVVVVVVLLSMLVGVTTVQLDSTGSSGAVFE